MKRTLKILSVIALGLSATGCVRWPCPPGRCGYDHTREYYGQQTGQQQSPCTSEYLVVKEQAKEIALEQKEETGTFKALTGDSDAAAELKRNVTAKEAGRLEAAKERYKACIEKMGNPPDNGQQEMLYQNPMQDPRFGQRPY